MKQYIVALAGYEGLDALYGLYSKDEAIAWVRELKEKKTIRAKKIMKGYKPDQVCLMKSKRDDPAKSREIKCCCGELPDDLKNKAMWLMG